jgi:hypothetical protein
MEIEKAISPMHRNKPNLNNDHECLRQVESTIREALKASGYHALRRLSCEFDGAVFSLRGQVSTYYEKQVAQQIALSHLGGRVCFDNQLDVVAGKVRSESLGKQRDTHSMALLT